MSSSSSTSLATSGTFTDGENEVYDNNRMYEGLGATAQRFGLVDERVEWYSINCLYCRKHIAWIPRGHSMSGWVACDFCKEHIDKDRKYNMRAIMGKMKNPSWYRWPVSQSVSQSV